jgi:hypothetical protein
VGPQTSRSACDAASATAGCEYHGAAACAATFTPGDGASCAAAGAAGCNTLALPMVSGVCSGCAYTAFAAEVAPDFTTVSGQYHNLTIRKMVECPAFAMTANSQIVGHNTETLEDRAYTVRECEQACCGRGWCGSPASKCDSLPLQNNATVCPPK